VVEVTALFRSPSLLSRQPYLGLSATFAGDQFGCGEMIPAVNPRFTASSGSTPSASACRAILLSDAEGTEDQIEDVVGGSGAGDFVEGTQRSVEIEQHHFVGNPGSNGVGRGGE